MMAVVESELTRRPFLRGRAPAQRSDEDQGCLQQVGRASRLPRSRLARVSSPSLPKKKSSIGESSALEDLQPLRRAPQRLTNGCSRWLVEHLGAIH